MNRKFATSFFVEPTLKLADVIFNLTIFLATIALVQNSKLLTNIHFAFGGSAPW